MQEQCARTGCTVWAFTKNAMQLSDCSVITSGTDGARIGEGPSVINRRNNNFRFENCKCRGYNFTGHLAHYRTTTRKVRGAIRCHYSVELATTWTKAQGFVVVMAFGREIHLSGNGLEGGS
jgi:hypothetical protein